ncbi:hypothetical protein, partial [Nonomuraea aridisoli]|uniref:hypothetical protein n=1 Tax=Nonomuraea aridisoli TaxID=2070368 RepID=UPI001C6528CE
MGARRAPLLLITVLLALIATGPAAAHTPPRPDDRRGDRLQGTTGRNARPAQAPKSAAWAPAPPVRRPGGAARVPVPPDRVPRKAAAEVPVTSSRVPGRV